MPGIRVDLLDGFDFVQIKAQAAPLRAGVKEKVFCRLVFLRRHPPIVELFDTATVAVDVAIDDGESSRRACFGRTWDSPNIEGISAITGADVASEDEDIMLPVRCACALRLGVGGACFGGGGGGDCVRGPEHVDFAVKGVAELIVRFRARAVK